MQATHKRSAASLPESELDEKMKRVKKFKIPDKVPEKGEVFAAVKPGSESRDSILSAAKDVKEKMTDADIENFIKLLTACGISEEQFQTMSNEEIFKAVVQKTSGVDIKGAPSQRVDEMDCKKYDELVAEPRRKKKEEEDAVAAAARDRDARMHAAADARRKETDAEVRAGSIGAAIGGLLGGVATYLADTHGFANATPGTLSVAMTAGAALGGILALKARGAWDKFTGKNSTTSEGSQDHLRECIREMIIVENSRVSTSRAQRPRSQRVR